MSIKIPMKIKLPDDVFPGRVINETDDHITLEIGKHEGATFSLLEDGDRFLTVAFVRMKNDRPKFWKPFSDGEAGA